MLITDYGVFDGNSWEETCQLIFKNKYRECGYQEMPASPGDFGIEGFVKNRGIAIQCYCPDDNYTQKELYEKQRNKITKDVKKLKENEAEIKARIGDCKISTWIFLTPIINNNDLLQHAADKEKEVRQWGLGILCPDVQILVQDAGFYAAEIRELSIANGDKISFIPPDSLALKPVNSDCQDKFEENIFRKNVFRCVSGNGELNSTMHVRLNQMTADNWLKFEKYLRKIELEAPEIHFRLAACISQYEAEIEELCLLWQGNANELVDDIKKAVSNRIKEAIPELNDTDRHAIAFNVVSRWIALCPIEFEEV